MYKMVPRTAAGESQHKSAALAVSPPSAPRDDHEIVPQFTPLPPAQPPAPMVIDTPVEPPAADEDLTSEVSADEVLGTLGHQVAEPSESSVQWGAGPQGSDVESAAQQAVP